MKSYVLLTLMLHYLHNLKIYKVTIQEMFHVYLNKFEIAVSHLFLIIFNNNILTLVNQISRNAQSPTDTKKISLNFIGWFKTVSEDE